MKNSLIFLSFLFCFCGNSSIGQIIYGEYPLDSFVVIFSGNTNYPAYIDSDASAQPLWQRGRTAKQFSPTDTLPVKGMMTDTLHPYPRLSNNSFTLVINSLSKNQIVTLWHRYTTDSTHAGGIVEYSFDLGGTWTNIKDGCNADDSANAVTGTRTENFYGKNNTLTTGDAAFTGISYNANYSRFQFFMGSYTKPGCAFTVGNLVMVRFRFVSDTARDTLAGWLIDSISVRHDFYNTLVSNVHQTQLSIYPNPTDDGKFIFPKLEHEQEYVVVVYNALGMEQYSMPYSHSLSLVGYPKGLYLYKVTNGTDVYTGKLMNE